MKNHEICGCTQLVHVLANVSKSGCNWRNIVLKNNHMVL